MHNQYLICLCKKYRQVSFRKIIRKTADFFRCYTAVVSSKSCARVRNKPLSRSNIQTLKSNHTQLVTEREHENETKNRVK